MTIICGCNNKSVTTLDKNDTSDISSSPANKAETRETVTSITDSQQSKTDGLDEQKEFDEFLNILFIDTVQTNTLILNSYLAEPENYGIIDAETTLGEYGK